MKVITLARTEMVKAKVATIQKKKKKVTAVVHSTQKSRIPGVMVVGQPIIQLPQSLSKRNYPNTKLPPRSHLKPPSKTVMLLKLESRNLNHK